MPNNRYTDPLAYSITNNPRGSYSTPMVNYTSMFDRAIEVGRSARPNVGTSPSSPVRTPAPGAASPSVLQSVAKIAGYGLLAGLAILAAGSSAKK